MGWEERGDQREKREMREGNEIRERERIEWKAGVSPHFLREMR